MNCLPQIGNRAVSSDRVTYGPIVTTKVQAGVELQRAIQSAQIVPYFQPIVHLRSGRLAGFEVLARWLHPQQGIIYPEHFIPIAETTGLIDPLTEKILEQAFVAIGGLSRRIRLSVNISPVQLNDRTLPERICSIADAAGFPLSDLVIEITETVLAASTDEAHQVVKELKARGAHLALDDFGTGYANLHHLQLLPFDEIKVDRSFVQSMTHRMESRKIVATVLGLGYALRLATVAEGIESEQQADMLYYLGCELGQGFLYGRAVPASELPLILAANTLSAPRQSRPTTEDIGSHIESDPGQRLALLQAIYDGAPVGLCFLDRNLRYVNLNRRLQAMSEVPDGVRVGKTIEEAAPHIFVQLEAFLHRALAGEAFSGVEIMSMRPGARGKINILLVSLQPARDETNEVIGISVGVVDITDRKIAEEALRESETHYRNTVELSPQVTWTADPDGKILSAGPLWQALTGLTLEQTLEEGWVEALHPDDVAPTGRAWAASIKTGNPVDVEYRVGKRDGVWHWVRARAAPRRGPNGEIIRWYGTLEDIGDRKRAEASLRECQSQLKAALERLERPLG